MVHYLRLGLAALAIALWAVPAEAQCTGVFPPATLCGNLGATSAPPRPFPASGTVVGPGSTTVGYFARWANTTGTQLSAFDLFGSANSWTGVQSFASLIATTADINGGTIDGTSIGATTPASGIFTTLTGNTSITTANIVATGGTINGTVIGGVTPANGTFTGLTFTTLNSNVPLNKLPLTSTNIIVGNGSNVGAGVAMSGDCTLDNAGAITCNSFGAWTSYTPTLSCASGTLTTATAAGRYKTFGKTVVISINIVITNVGTCATAIRATLPNTIRTGGPGITLVAQNVSTFVTASCFGAAAATLVSCQQYNAGIPATTGQNLTLSGVYESD